MKSRQTGLNLNYRATYIGIEYADQGGGSSYRPAFCLNIRDGERPVDFFERSLEVARLLMARNYDDATIDHVELFTENTKHVIDRADIFSQFENCGLKITKQKIY